jgi:hypothetical protein
MVRSPMILSSHDFVSLRGHVAQISNLLYRRPPSRLHVCRGLSGSRSHYMRKNETNPSINHQLSTITIRWTKSAPFLNTWRLFQSLRLCVNAFPAAIRGNPRLTAPIRGMNSPTIKNRNSKFKNPLASRATASHFDLLRLTSTFDPLLPNSRRLASFADVTPCLCAEFRAGHSTFCIFTVPDNSQSHFVQLPIAPDKSPLTFLRSGPAGTYRGRNRKFR